MITNFEEFTYKITEHEKKCAKVIENFLRKNPLFYKSQDLISLVYWSDANGIHPKLNGARIRAIINYLRRTTAPNIIATSKGYKLTDSIEELHIYHDSLEERIDSIKVISEQTLLYIKKLKERDGFFRRLQKE